MDDPFGSPTTSTLPRQRSRPNLAHHLPAPPSSRSLASQLRDSPTKPSQKLEYTGHALHQHLSSLLEQKTAQLQMLGTMGQEILKQQQELEERIKGFDEDDGIDEEVGEDTKVKLKDLDEAMRQWEAQNEDMMRELGGKMPDSLEGLDLKAPVMENGTTSASMNRRQRNAQHRALDMEFATEIGQNLLAEVRRLQSLLNEREKSVEKLNEEKDSWEVEKASLVGAVRNAESSVDRYKEENWNLEVNLQELRAAHSDAQEQLTKSNIEHTRLNRSILSVRELAEMHKTDAEKNAQLLEDLKAKHETDMAQARKNYAGLQRDKSDLLTELHVERNRRVSALRGRMSRGASASPGLSTPGGADESFEEDEDVFAATVDDARKRSLAAENNALSPGNITAFSSSPDPTPSKDRVPLSDVYINEIDELRENLERARAEIATLKGEQHKARRMASREDITPRTSGDWEEEDSILSGRGRGTVRGRRGRGRGFAASLSRKLGFSRVPSSLSNGSTPNDKSFNSTSTGTPDLLRYRESVSPGLDSPSLASRALSSETSLDRPTSFMGPSTALADELGSGNLDSMDYASGSNATDWSPEKQPQAYLENQVEVTTPTKGVFAESTKSNIEESTQPTGERTPTKPAKALPIAVISRRPSSVADTTTDGETDYADAESTMDVATPREGTAELPTDADESSYATGREYATAESSAGSDSDEGDYTQRLGISGSMLGLGGAAAAAGGYAAYKQAHKVASRDLIREKIVERIVEVPVEKIVEVEKRVEVPVEVIKEVMVEKPIEVIKEVFVDRPVEVIKEVIIDRPVEVIKEVIVEKPVEVIKEVLSEKPIEVIKEIIVDRPVEVIKEVIVEKPVEVIKEVIVDRPVEVIKEVIVEKLVEVIKEVIVDRPVEVIKEVVVEKPIEVIKEVIVDRHVEVIKEVPVDRPVEIIKEVIIDRPVEVIKEVIVDRPVEIIKELVVEKSVEVIKEVEKPVEVIKEVEKIIEVPKIVEVEKIVERIVEKEVEVPKIVEVEKIIEKIVNVDREVEKPVERIVEIPKIVEVEKIVEKIVEKPVEVFKQVEVEKIVEVERIVEKPVEVIREVEKIVEVQVDRVVEVPVEKIVEKIVEVPVEVVKEVEKIVEVPVEVIKEVEKIVELPVEVIREVIKTIEVPVEVLKTVEIPVEVIKEVSKTVEVPIEVVRIVEVIKEVEKIVEVPVEVIKTVEVPVDRIVEKIVEKRVEVPVEKIVPMPSPTPSSPTVSPDLGIWRVQPGANYDFLKAPPPSGSLGGKTRASTETSALGLGFPADDGLPATRGLSPALTVDGLPPASPSASVDRTLPPTMSLPPPPTIPPPAEQKKTSTGPPPRPLSPPPDEFVSRTARRASRPAVVTKGAMGPPESVIRKPSRTSVRPPPSPAASAFETRRRGHRGTLPASGQSSFSMRNDNGSISSMGSVVPPGEHKRSGSVVAGTTDPATIHAITQTMIGEYLWKYTRRALGKGQSENRHKRFFWIHPYTKTLYWSASDPGSLGAQESSAKSVVITNVKAIDDANNSPPGLHSQSIVVSTTGRDIQFTAESKDRHDLWMSALLFLLSESAPTGVANTLKHSSTVRAMSSRSLAADEQGRLTYTPTIPKSPMSMRSLHSVNSFTMTPKAYPRPPSALSARAASAMEKRSGTPAFEYYRRHEVPATIHGGHRYKGTYKGAPFMEDFDVITAEDGDDPDASFEGMDNVRACCDGRHTVGHHHHPENESVTGPPERPAPRSVTPSLRAFSMRSRRASAASSKRPGIPKGKFREEEPAVPKIDERSKSVTGHI
ncbi:hypothetical protein BD324DRAFT_606985 [Kockovaella imperatae]|uniref:PH domain-containing protein n=1 Tax=Kockovaella imperatae TaxID=4999 RepID=A0A1Y1UNW5_9TREE|nr:hypothetical protein BD324DRAFT_606985 [Kockovaella imperatae]ORX39731.1 hypothetical protein BD324DRAFT_606985 [Kockovaella imperatae]